MNEHLKECGYALVKCQNKDCLLRVARQDLAEHDKFCDYSVVECTNAGCAVSMIRLKLSEHQRETCRYMLAQCPVPGCNYKNAGHTLGNHLTKEHYDIFIRHLSELKDVYAKDQDVGIFTVRWS